LTFRTTIVTLLAVAATAVMAGAPTTRAIAAEAIPVRAQQQDPKAREITAEVVRSESNETVTLRATFPDETPGVKVSLFNLLGRLVEVHSTTVAAKGLNLFQFRTRGLPNGPYIIVLEASGQRLINKVMLSR
jgi:hypothetical protein